MKRIAVVGAAGYSGAEAVSILLDHPSVTIAGVFGSPSRGAGGAAQPFSDVFTRFRGRMDLPLLAGDAASVLSCRPDVVFLATPHEASLDLAPRLMAAGVTVFDLSAAFRLKDASLYPKHYGFEHTEPGLLEKSAYGIPELFRDRIARADLVACAGCYCTSAILALAPLVRAGALAPGRRPIIDATSGVSGAGRSPALKSLFCEVSLQPYGVFNHRHQPEIDAYAGVPTIFTPHLGPYERGILSTIHVDLAPGWTADRIGETLRGAYGREPFVRLCKAGTWPSVADVRHTNFCDLAWAVDESGTHAIVVSALDNLVKGAAGQAVQCMNIRLGFDEAAGLVAGAGGGRG